MGSPSRCSASVNLYGRMPSRARERQLAKLAERRRADRMATVRRRRRIVLTSLGVVVVALLAWAGIRTRAGSGTSASPTPSLPSATASPSRALKAGQISGTVTPQPAPTQVACGAKAPPLAGKPHYQFVGPPPIKIDSSKQYTAVMKTSCGTITIQLDAKNAPETVNSFVLLARSKFFDGQYFTRLDTSLDVVQGGDPTGTGSGSPGYSIPDELHPTPTYGTGTVAMANGGPGHPNTGGSQFFLITGPNGRVLNPTPVYTVFGKIVGGLDVAQRIQNMPTADPAATAPGPGQAPAKAIYIDSVTIVEN
jgi:cyclophilin family peptidyl-prolyl cis-trans isomerase